MYRLRQCLLTPALRCGQLVCVGLLGACAGFSGPALIQPEISGLLLYQNEPITEARVLLAQHPGDQACESLVAETSTDASGYFLLPARHAQRFAWRWTDLGSPAGWRLCFAAGDEFRSWLSPPAAQTQGAEPLLLHCDLSRPAAQSCQAQHQR